MHGRLGDGKGRMQITEEVNQGRLKQQMKIMANNSKQNGGNMKHFPEYTSRLRY